MKKNVDNKNKTEINQTRNYIKKNLEAFRFVKFEL